jgi:hypothetical protein
LGKADAAQQVLEAGIAAQRIVKLFNLKPDECGGPFGVSSFEILERPSSLAQGDVSRE